MEEGKPKLLDQLRQQIRVKNYSIRTETVYAEWVKRYIHFHHYRHPSEMGVVEIEAFLTHLAVMRDVSASTQNQALAALLFLYKEVLKLELPRLQDVVRAKKPGTCRWCNREEVEVLLAQMQGVQWLVANVLYGSGLRLLEALRLRVKDVDFTRCEIVVRDGKDRVTMLPKRVSEPLQAYLEKVQRLHREDLAEGFGEVNLPFALARKYPGLPGSGDGSLSSRRSIVRVILVARGSFATTCTRRPSSELCARRRGVRVLSSMQRLIRCAIPLRHICWRRARTFVPCRSCWGTPT